MTPRREAIIFGQALKTLNGYKRRCGDAYRGWPLPNLSVDIPGGGGKVGLVPDFSRGKEGRRWHFKGWDNLEGTYIRPSKEEEGFSNPLTEDLKEYEREWDILKNQSYGKWDKS